MSIDIKHVKGKTGISVALSEKLPDGSLVVATGHWFDKNELDNDIKTSLAKEVSKAINTYNSKK